jgi:protein-disulfide isomerase
MGQFGLDIFLRRCGNMDNRKRQGRAKRIDAIREARRKKRQRQRLTTLLTIGGGVLILVAIIVLVSIKNASTPVGKVTPITPIARPMANGTAMGDPNAPVKVEVWEDFQCPMCKNFTESQERQVMETYVKNGQVYYVFHQYPFIDTLDNLSSTNESHQAANASMCANEQGRFWDYHDILFTNWTGENDGGFSDKRLAAFAETLGLDMNAFQACFKENRYKNQIEEDFAAGKKAGVSGTPSVFVNGTMLTPGYVPSYDQMKNAIDAALTGK